MAFGGATVVRGRAKALVVATGDRTMAGLLAREVLSATAGRPPLLIRLERFTRLIGIAVAVASLAVGALGVCAATAWPKCSSSPSPSPSPPSPRACPSPSPSPSPSPPTAWRAAA
jgi:magnesium-transporting ATPase (P-type)